MRPWASTPPVTGELCRDSPARNVVSTIRCLGLMNSSSSGSVTTSAVANFLAMVPTVFDVSARVAIVSNMSSKDEILTALDAADVAWQALTALPIHTLRPADQRAVLIRLETMDKKLAALQRRLLGSMVAGPTPVEFAGAPWAEVLARRLRISVGEAQRRIADAAEPRSA